MIDPLENEFIDFDHFTKLALAPFSSALLLNEEGEVVALKASNIEDLGTLPLAAQTVQKYLPLSDGDVAALNDPYSGGTTLHSLSLVSAITMGGGKKKDAVRFWLATRFPLSSQLSWGDSVEQEGVRWPPSPLVMNRQINKDMLAALAQHPAASPQLSEEIHGLLEAHLRGVKNIERMSGTLRVIPNKKFQKALFKRTREKFLHDMHEFALGKTQVHLDVDDQARLVLSLELSEKQLIFDFSGTSKKASWNLTSTATFGACLGAVCVLLNKNLILNNGVFEAIQVTTPGDTFVNAKYPAPVLTGMIDGSGMIAQLVLTAFDKLNSKLSFAQSAFSHVPYQLRFSDARHLFDLLPPGIPATKDTNGTDALSLWRTDLHSAPIETLESRYPVLFKSCSFRQKSGGNGLKTGGNGFTKVIELLDDADLYWHVPLILTKPEGAQGGKAATAAEIAVESADGEKNKMDGFGKVTVKKGSVVALQTSGGGGYGEKETDSTTSKP